MANPQYDPNYRQFDVEGYRVYRGRVDSPTSLQLIAQFDYKGTVFRDYTGQVNPDPACAPELGINGCPVPFDSLVPGMAPTAFTDIPLVGDLVQVRRGDRVAGASGRAVVVRADTAVTGAESGCLTFGRAEECPLRDTGVPFAFVDHGVRNNLRYFYAVTAFDVNSFQSVPSSLESPRKAAPVTPVTSATNYSSVATVKTSLWGRGTSLDTAAAVPALDGATGRFSGPFPPANGFSIELTNLVQEVLTGSTSVSITVDSLRLEEKPAAVPGDQEPVTTYFLTALADSAVRLEMSIDRSRTSATRSDSSLFHGRPSRSGVGGEFRRERSVQPDGTSQASTCPETITPALGAEAARPAPRASPRAAHGVRIQRAPVVRWAVAAAERDEDRSAGGSSRKLRDTRCDDRPQQRRRARGRHDASYAARLRDRGGRLWSDRRHARRGATGRGFQPLLGCATARWIRSSTSPTTCRCRSTASSWRGSWGILNQAATTGSGSFDQRPDVLTTMDFTCVEPLASSNAIQASYPCTAPPYRLSRTASPGPIAIWDQTSANARTAAVRPGAGFALYLAGNLTIFELSGGVPAAGAVWTLRSYVGAIAAATGRRAIEGRTSSLQCGGPSPRSARSYDWSTTS